MTSMNPYTTQDFRQALLSLLPMGPIWSHEPNQPLWYWANIIGESYTRNSERAFNLLVVAFPATATELLDEWESTLGLPDPYIGPISDISERQKMVVDYLTAPLSDTIAYYIAYVKKRLGLTINITQFAPARFGLPFGQSFGGEDWAFAWKINGDFTPENYQWLFYIFSRISPPHTLVIYKWEKA